MVNNKSNSDNKTNNNKLNSNKLNNNNNKDNNNKDNNNNNNNNNSNSKNKNNSKKPTKNLDAGHRERLRNQIINDIDNMPLEKTFEYFLCTLIPRRDTRVLSKTILDKVNNNLSILINKDYSYLKSVLKLSDSVIAGILNFKKMLSICNQEELIDDKNKVNSIDKLSKYFQREIGLKDTEHTMAVFLDATQRIIETKTYTNKSSILTSLNTSEIITIALNNNCRFLIISHNHPSGDSKPSQEDRTATNSFEDTIMSLKKFQLVDHIIVSKNNTYSFYKHKLLKNTNSNIDMSTKSIILS